MTTQALIDEVRQLLDSELCDSALQLAELECKPRLHDKRVAAAERLALLRTYCQCLAALKRHRESLRTITEFISGPVRAQLVADDLEQMAREISDVRWELGEHDMCLAQLRQIPRSHRTVRDIARMARCAALIQNGDADELYAELLRRQPNAAEAYAYLSARGRSVPGFDASTYHDVASLTTARSLALRLEYRKAAAELQRLARRHRANAQIVAQQATCYFMLNDARKARLLYERARALDASLVQEMGTYAELLMQAGDSYAVYALGSQLLKADQTRPEGWVAMARYFLTSGKTEEALAIVWKAQALAPTHSDAYYAEGGIQMASGSAEEAAEVFLKAHELERSVLTYRGIIDAYVQCGKYKNAFLYAKELAELMPRHAGALAMVGVVLSHSPESHDKAAKLLEGALDIDSRCTEAIAALASLYVANQQLDQAIALLEKHLPENESDQMYTRYADVLTLANELPKAAVNYTVALELNPNNERAKVGYDRVDRLMHPNAESEDDDDVDAEAEQPEVDEEEDVDFADQGMHEFEPSDIANQGMHGFEPSDMSDDDML
ncbi:Anaphase promoting complex subunit 7 [Coemansia sp. RSA 2618]|nr:Anaphase promoting complex subunit 7 [Coemansia sp. RSA 2618]